MISRLNVMSTMFTVNHTDQTEIFIAPENTRNFRFSDVFGGYKKALASLMLT